MDYLITGHTGFKGSWLALMLEMQGHSVSGIALDPPIKSLFNEAKLSPFFKHDFRLDIRDRNATRQAIEYVNPDVIIHLAAQPLVRESYRTPVETFDTNVMGTLNVLEATRGLKNLKAVLVITTDKVYKNENHLHGYIETDKLGGDDPYSASKAAADIVAQSWILSFATAPISIARAGNVIGGGDWAADRIVPDLVNAFSKGSVPELRYPNSIRPWQHVLDCLHGYLALINYSIENGTGGEWNFGPDLSEKFTVSELVTEFAKKYGVKDRPYELASEVSSRESGFLLLDSTKSREALGWKDKLNFQNAVAWTADWYIDSGSMSARKTTLEQISRFANM